MKRIIVLATVIVGTILLIGIKLQTKPFQNSKKTQDTTTQAITEPSVNTEKAPEAVEALVEFNENSVPFTFHYPQSAAMYKTGVFVYLKELGPTQTISTEIFDGYLVSINMWLVQEKSVEEFVQEKLKESKESAEVTSEIRQFNTTKYQGYSYTVQGLEVFTHIYLINPDEKTQLLEVSYTVEDPRNSGFQDKINTVINSVQFNPKAFEVSN